MALVLRGSSERGIGQKQERKRQKKREKPKKENKETQLD